MGILFIRVPYYIGDLNRDPDLENYPVVSILPGGSPAQSGQGLNAKCERKVPHPQSQTHTHSLTDTIPHAACPKLSSVKPKP